MSVRQFTACPSEAATNHTTFVVTTRTAHTQVHHRDNRSPSARRAFQVVSAYVLLNRVYVLPSTVSCGWTAWDKPQDPA